MLSFEIVMDMTVFVTYEARFWQFPLSIYGVTPEELSYPLSLFPGFLK